ncbi:MAG: ferritin-like domain-containing protein [Shimia sp.]
MTNRIDALKTLLTRLVDSREGYREILDDIENPTLKGMIQRFHEHRDQYASEIRTALATAGEKVDEDGSLLASAHRVFVGLRDALSSGDEAVVAETIRGEKKLVEAYDEAIASETATDPEYHTLIKQHQVVKEELGQLEVRKDIAAE